MDLFNRELRQKIKIQDDNFEDYLDLIMNLKDDLQSINIQNIAKAFSHLFEKILQLKEENRMLNKRFDDLSLLYQKLQYKDIYEYVEKENAKHYILDNKNSITYKLINELLKDTFRGIYFEKQWLKPVCLSEIIEYCEQELGKQAVDIDKNKEL